MNAPPKGPGSRFNEYDAVFSLFVVGSLASHAHTQQREHQSELLEDSVTACPAIAHFPVARARAEKDPFAVAKKTKARGHVIKWSFILPRSTSASAAK